jgi:hypothetical protein
VAPKSKTPRPPRRIFLLSPANLSGRRASYLLSPRSRFALAVSLAGDGAPLGEVFSFVSGLYFRGKLAYARAFAAEEIDSCVRVITAARGLMSPLAPIVHDDLLAMAGVKIHHENEHYRAPLERDAATLAAQLGDLDEVILLGSIATPKYLDPLSKTLGSKLKVPAEFIGRGDMSRGSLMLRAVRDMQPLTYIPVPATPAKPRPPKRKTPTSKPTTKPKPKPRPKSNSAKA